MTRKPDRKATQTPERTYVGEPCPRGHDGTRYRSNRVCVTCTRERNAATPNVPYVRKADRRPAAAKATPCSPAPMQLDCAPKIRPGGDQGDAPPLLCESLAGAMAARGLHHVALTYLDASRLWQCVTLQAGYTGQVTRTGATMGEALERAMEARRGPSDELLDAIG